MRSVAFTLLRLLRAPHDFLLRYRVDAATRRLGQSCTLACYEWRFQGDHDVSHMRLHPSDGTDNMRQSIRVRRPRASLRCVLGHRRCPISLDAGHGKGGDDTLQSRRDTSNTAPKPTPEPRTAVRSWSRRSEIQSRNRRSHNAIPTRDPGRYRHSRRAKSHDWTNGCRGQHKAIGAGDTHASTGGARRRPR